jgi:hypothetical protein
MTTIRILTLFIFISFTSQSQDTLKLSHQHLRSGIVLATASILPHYVGYQTYLYNTKNPYSYLFTGVWFSFGLVLDIEATKHFIQDHKLKKKSLHL